MKNSIFVSIIIFITASIPAQVLDNKFNNSSLLYSATISVTIGGDFPITGSFPALISERVDQFITRLYIEAKERSVRITNDPQMIAKIESKLDDYSLRGILLKRSNGDELIVDLQRFRSGGDFSYNPYLKNDDVLIFPVNDIIRNFFTVSGAVNNPGTFFFVEGDSLSDALELVMGINKAYEDVNHISVSRLSYDGGSLVTDTLDIASNFKLQRADQIKVIAPETERKNLYVLVLGEVNSPGPVPITKNTTTTTTASASTSSWPGATPRWPRV